MKKIKKWVVINRFNKYKISNSGEVIIRKSNKSVKPFEVEGVGKCVSLKTKEKTISVSIISLIKESFKNIKDIPLNPATTCYEKKTSFSSDEDDYGSGEEWDKLKEEIQEYSKYHNKNK